MSSCETDDTIDINECDVINLTPYIVNVYASNPLCGCTQPDFVFPRGMIIARCKERRESIGCMTITSTRDSKRQKTTIPISNVVYEEILSLPPPIPKTIYIVSQIVAQQCSDRKDVFFPGSQLFDKDGNVIGCLGLSRAR